MSVQVPIFVFAGLLALSILSIICLIFLAAQWIASTRREDALLERHAAERHVWSAERRCLYDAVMDLAKEVAAVRNEVAARRIRRS